jgi:hypothetical protein
VHWVERWLQIRGGGLFLFILIPVPDIIIPFLHIHNANRCHTKYNILNPPPK